MRLRRVLGLTAALATLVAGQAVLTAPVTAARPVPSPGSPAAAERALRAASTGPVTLRRDRAGAVHLIGTAAGHPLRRPSGLPSGADPVSVARAHLSTYAPLFGVRDQRSELRTAGRHALGRGLTSVRFQQHRAGLPVLGGELVAVVDDAGDLLSVNGETAAATSVPAGSVPAERAAQVARAAVARGTGSAARLLTLTAPQQWVYDPSLVGAPGPAGARVVWRTEVRSTVGRPVRTLVLVDATTGAVALSVDQLTHLADRRVCDFQNQLHEDWDCPQASFPVVRAEGAAPVTGGDEVNAAYDNAGKTFDFYLQRFGRNGVNGAGGPLTTAVRYCGYDMATGQDGSPSLPGCQYYNAFWDGKQTTFGDGFASADDVVGHELTHGVTEKTSGLLYYYESGAINESVSDVMGELVDLADGDADDLAPATRWVVGEDLSSTDLQRSLRNPPAHGQPASTSDPLWDSDWEDNGGVHQNSGVGNKAAFLVTDGGTFGGKTVTGLGLDKAALLYYRAGLLLTSGADYRDLAAVLTQSCTALVGTTATGGTGSPSASGAFATADCQEVLEATQAVGMSAYPTREAAMPAVPPYCATGYSPTNLFHDTFNAGAISAATWLRSGWGLSTAYQPSPAAGGAAFARDDTDPGVDGSAPVGADRRLTMVGSVTLPRGRSSFLRFDHAYALDWFGPGIGAAPTYWDGGFVEVSVDGAAWRPLAVSRGGYNAPIEAANGRLGYGGDSRGWYSSRSEVTAWAGHTVRMRFRLYTDGFRAASAAYGWWVDNVRLYTCRAPGAPGSVAVRNALGATARLTWTAAAPNPGFTIASYVVDRPGASPVTLPASARSHLFRGLVRGRTYPVTVFARNNRGVAGPVVSRSLRID